MGLVWHIYTYLHWDGLQTIEDRLTEGILFLRRLKWLDSLESWQWQKQWYTHCSDCKNFPFRLSLAVSNIVSFPCHWGHQTIVVILLIVIATLKYRYLPMIGWREKWNRNPPWSSLIFVGKSMVSRPRYMVTQAASMKAAGEDTLSFSAAGNFWEVGGCRGWFLWQPTWNFPVIY